MANVDDTDFSDLDISGDDGPAPGPNYHKQKRAPGGTKKFLAVLVVLVVLAGLGTVSWKVIKKPSPKASTAATNHSTSLPSTTNDVPEVTTTKTYHSDNLNLQLAYPSDWILSTQSDSSIRIVSPAFSYKTLVGDTVMGNFRVYIRQTARPVDDKYIGRGVAIGPSQSLTYTKPSSTQRQSTYLTNFGLDTPDNFAFFFIAGNFNLNKGDTLGPSYGVEPGTDIISGGYSSSSLTDDMATNQVSVSYYAGTNAYKQAVDIIKSLQLF